MNKTRVCPICLHDKSELLHTQKFADHFEHRIVHCVYCGFDYVNNTPSQKYYDEYYKNQSKYEGTRQHEMHDRLTYETFDFILKKYISKDANILDVGCSTGKLLNFIKNKGYKNLLGIEPAPECKAIAKKDYGINVETATLDRFKTKKRYDLIIFSQVFEHLTDLRGAVIKSKELLKKNGMIFIGVPDAENFYKKFDEPFGKFSTEHINFFTKQSLSRLLDDFENIYVKTDNYAILSLWQKKIKKESNIDKYINLSQIKMEKILETINSLPKNTIIWGVGALTQRLLKTTNIKNKIYKFVDSNKNLIGKKIHNIEIISPSELRKYNNPILISSFRFKNEILEYIRKNKIKNKIFTFQ